MTFTTCSGIVAPVDCADATPTDTSDLESGSSETGTGNTAELPVTHTMPVKGSKARRF